MPKGEVFKWFPLSVVVSFFYYPLVGFGILVDVCYVVVTVLKFRGLEDDLCVRVLGFFRCVVYFLPTGSGAVFKNIRWHLFSHVFPLPSSFFVVEYKGMPVRSVDVFRYCIVLYSLFVLFSVVGLRVQ